MKPFITSQLNLKHHALVTAVVTVEKEIPFPFKGDIIDAIFERDIMPGLYGFPTVEKRDKFISLLNSCDSEARPCVAVALQML